MCIVLTESHAFIIIVPYFGGEIQLFLVFVGVHFLVFVFWQ